MAKNDDSTDATIPKLHILPIPLALEALTYHKVCIGFPLVIIIGGEVFLFWNGGFATGLGSNGRFHAVLVADEHFNECNVPFENKRGTGF